MRNQDINLAAQSVMMEQLANPKDKALACGMVELLLSLRWSTIVRQ
jgi:hypothetical protein